MKRSLWVAGTVGATVLLAAWDVRQTQVLQEARKQRDALNQTIAVKMEKLRATEAERTAGARELTEAESELATLRQLVPQATSSADNDLANAWIARVRSLQKLCAAHDDQRIPEMRLLTDTDWLTVARTTSSLETDADQRRALAAVRSAAKAKFLRPVADALQAYLDANGGKPPATISDLAPFYKSPPDAAALARYEVYAATRTAGNRVVVREREPVDTEYDQRFSAMPGGGVLSQGGSNAWKRGG